MHDQTAANQTTAAAQRCPRVGVSVPLDLIASPGAYVCNWSGHLLRIPEASLVPGGPLALNMVGGRPLMVTKVSDDPDLPLSQARGLARGLGLSVDF